MPPKIAKRRPQKVMNDFICQNPIFLPKTSKNLVYSNNNSALNIDTQKRFPIYCKDEFFKSGIDYVNSLPAHIKYLLK